MLLFFAALGTVGCFSYFISQAKKRRDPLKNSAKVSTDIQYNMTRGVHTIVVYNPSAAFVSNMKKGAKNTAKELGSLWSAEKTALYKVWSVLRKGDKKDMICRLLEELKSNIQPYSDTDDLLLILCPELCVESLLHESSDGECKPEGIVQLIQILLNDQEREKLSSGMVVLAADDVQGNIDPNKSKTPDFKLMTQVEEFLATLRELCLVMYMKQLLTRYRSELKRPPLLKRLWNKNGSSIVLGLVAVVITFCLDRFGILEAILASYKSPFDD